MRDPGGWDVVRAGVREQIGPRAYDAWFRTLEGEVEEQRVVIRCPDRFSRDWIRERYGDVLQRVSPRGVAIQYEVHAREAAPRAERLRASEILGKPKRRRLLRQESNPGRRRFFTALSSCVHTAK